ncbi:MAG: hypothetical protein ACOC8A_02255 [bacterium]
MMRKLGGRGVVGLAVALAALAALVAAGCGESEWEPEESANGGPRLSAPRLTPPRARRLIEERLALPPRGITVLREMTQRGRPLAELLEAEGVAENFTAGLLLMPFARGLDVQRERVPSPAQLMDILRRNEITADATLVRPQHIADVKILDQGNGSARGTFAWKVPGVMSGTALFVARRKEGQWRLAYLGIPRQGSTNPRDGYAIFPREVGPYRDPQVRLPEGIRTGSGATPPGDWHFVNVRQDGSIRLAKGGGPATEAEVERLIADARETGSSVILRGDARVPFRHVRPLLLALAGAKVPRVWFCAAPERFVRVDFPNEPDAAPGEAVPDHIWIRIASAPGGLPQLVIDQRSVRHWSQARLILERLSRVPGVQRDPVILAPEPDAQLGQVVRLIDILKQREFVNIWFSAGMEQPDDEGAPPGERAESEVDLDEPIEDIPIDSLVPTAEDPGPDLDLPPADERTGDLDRPSRRIDLPFRTPVPRRDIRPIYSGRTRSGRKQAMGGPGGTTKEAERSVMAGLYWLAKAQEPDGRWSCKKWDGSGEHDVGMTGLALLAFLGAGYTHTRGTFKDTVAKGLAWLKASQKDSGSFGWKTFYEQGIATMAVCEAFAMSGSEQVGAMAQRAVDYIVHTQPDHGGFRYLGNVDQEHGDLCVTGWQILALRSAMLAELNVPEQAVERFRVFLKSTYRGDGQSAYLAGNPEPGSPTMWAIGMHCRQFLGSGDAEVRAAADALLDHAKAVEGETEKGNGRFVGDLYFTYWSSLAMFQMGDNSEYWLRWNKLFRDALVAQQVRQIRDERGRFVRGSWDPANHQWGKRGGRVYSTAMAVLCLEVTYRFLPLHKE